MVYTRELSKSELHQMCKNFIAVCHGAASALEEIEDKGYTVKFHGGMMIEMCHAAIEHALSIGVRPIEASAPVPEFIKKLKEKFREEEGG